MAFMGIGEHADLDTGKESSPLEHDQKKQQHQQMERPREKITNSCTNRSSNSITDYAAAVVAWDTKGKENSDRVVRPFSIIGIT